MSGQVFLEGGVHIQVYDLPPVSNVCNQTLREVWRDEVMSIAHVVMEPRAVSLLHHHVRMTEVYYIASGSGVMELDGEAIPVYVGSFVVVLPGVRHRLRNFDTGKLVHTVTCMPPFDQSDVILDEEGG